VGFGLATAFANLSFAREAPEGLLLALSFFGLPFPVPAVVGLALVGLSFPERLPRQDRLLLYGCVAAGMLVAAPAVVGVALYGAPRDLVALGLPASLGAPLAAHWALGGVLVGTMWALLFLLVSRLRRDPEPARTRAIALVTVAIALYPGTFPTQFLHQAEPLQRSFGLTSIAATAALAGLWIWKTRRPGVSGLGRNVALFVCAWPLLAMLYATYAGGGVGAFGVARALTVLILAYAILRHHVLGIDVKLRWTISRTTVAAVFVAVFFLGTEAAQQFFGETLGSTYLGIAAAGGLVFAIAPLQRLADRLAARAIPVPAPMTPALPLAGPETEAAYRNALRMALRDRRIGADEAAALGELADRLGLRAAAAMRLEHEVRDELERIPGGRRSGPLRSRSAKRRPPGKGAF
jgi:hypothetical protein